MSKFNNLWCYEAVRLREQRPPSVDDQTANEKALESSSDIAARLFARARVISGGTGLQTAFVEARSAMRLSALAVSVLGLLAGISAAMASLGDGTQPVNVIWALVSLLLLPTLMLVIWLASFMVSSESGGWFGRLWQLTLGRLLSAGPRAIVWKAWLALVQRARSERWWLGLLTHTIWFSVLLGMVLAMFTAFSLRHYTFVWQTTWLSDGVFIQFAQAVGAWPSSLGFTVPDVQTIRDSGNVALDVPGARMAWANWLMGAVVVFGLLPRLLAMTASILMVRHLHRRLMLKLDDAYALAIAHKFERLVANSQVDGPPGAQESWPQISGIAPEDALTDAAAAVLEASLSEAVHSQLGIDTALLPPIDDRASRKQAQEHLSQLKPRRLLVVLDARQTPDRGLMRTLLDLASQAVNTRVLLLHHQDARARLPAWQERLQAVGLPSESANAEDILAWLRDSSQ